MVSGATEWPCALLLGNHLNRSGPIHRIVDVSFGYAEFSQLGTYGTGAVESYRSQQDAPMLLADFEIFVPVKIGDDRLGSVS